VGLTYLTVIFALFFPETFSDKAPTFFRACPPLTQNSIDNAPFFSKGDFRGIQNEKLSISGKHILNPPFVPPLISNSLPISVLQLKGDELRCGFQIIGD
jgi:hypothetical protein